MSPDHATVFLPCHTLDDFPTWLEEDEAEDLLAAWVAAWHPVVVAAVGSPPQWSSIDLPVPAGPRIGIVPAAWDDRFAAQFDSACTVGSSFVRRTTGVESITRAAADRLGVPPGAMPGDALAQEFQALGLAGLLAELLARRMRTHADLESTGFPAAVVAAARAAVSGRDDDARESLRQAFDAISATRARYYPVDSYVVDLVLLADSSSATAIAAAIDSPVPVAVAVTGDVLASLAATRPDAINALRAAVSAGRVEACGGPADVAPLDLATPESAWRSFTNGVGAFVSHLGVPPASFARAGAGAVHLLPQLVAGFGLEGGIWTVFDGSPLPDVGGGVIRWQAGGAAIDLLAASPVDAGAARTVLSLHETLGDALDRDHVAAVLLAQYAGSGSRWHRLVRRIGGATNLLGTFVTPRELARRAAGAGTPVTLEPDAFPPTLPRGAASAGARSIDEIVAAAAAEARGIVAAARPWSVTSVAASPPSPPAAAPPRRRWPSFQARGRGREVERLVLDNGFLRVEAHARTGGVLSLRRHRDAANRLSQQLAIRTTRPAGGVGSGWESADDRAEFTAMVADSVERGHDAIISRGRLVTRDGQVAARYDQRLSLVAGMPLAVLDVEIRVERPLGGPLLENHVAARFAWHENEHVEIRRSLLTQSVVTERTRFTAPHFIEIVPEASRFDRTADTVTILTAGLPWHVRSTPHVLDAVLAGEATAVVTRRLALGLGLPRPWDAALAFTSGASLGGVMPGLPDHVRLTVHESDEVEGRVVRARVGLIESTGLPGAVSVDWGRPVARAAVVDGTGTPRAEPAVAIDGTRTVVSLARFEWLHLELEFAG